MRRLAAVLFAGILLATIAAFPVTFAVFHRTRTATADLATGSILPPTSLAATVAGGTVTLTWTPTISTAVTGYDVLRSATSGSGYGVVSSVTPRTATATTDVPGSGTWYYVLRSVLASWTSALSNEATATIAGGLTTGVVGCSANAADTGGDGNGYETTSGNACALDGAVARDANSGTNTSTSCANAGKDRHRFWGYAFGLPASVASIDGIGVRLRARLNNNGGTSLMCVQLSWDGGTNWTATQSITPTSTMTTFTLGGTADTWGRAWALGELDPAQFRVRVIDVSSQTTKSFLLDFIGVEVGYTP
jgi:hypothetical protein